MEITIFTQEGWNLQYLHIRDCIHSIYSWEMEYTAFRYGDMENIVFTQDIFSWAMESTSYTQWQMNYKAFIYDIWSP